MRIVDTALQIYNRTSDERPKWRVPSSANRQRCTVNLHAANPNRNSRGAGTVSPSSCVIHQPLTKRGNPSRPLIYHTSIRIHIVIMIIICLLQCNWYFLFDLIIVDLIEVVVYQQSLGRHRWISLNDHFGIQFLITAAFIFIQNTSWSHYLNSY